MSVVLIKNHDDDQYRAISNNPVYNCAISNAALASFARSADRKFAESIRRKPAQHMYDIGRTAFRKLYTCNIPPRDRELCTVIGSIDCCLPLVWFFSGSIRPTLSRPRPTSIFLPQCRALVKFFGVMMIKSLLNHCIKIK